MPVLTNYQRAIEFCNRQRVTEEDRWLIDRAQLVLGLDMPGPPGTNATGQADAMRLFAGWVGTLGLQYFDADEAAAPNHRDIAGGLGWQYLVPPTYLWPWVGLVLRVSDIVRESVGRSVRLRNLWRPTDYNAAVRGSAKGDHPDACGADLDFSSSEDQRVAEGVLRSLYPLNDLQLSVGLGSRSLHVGVLSHRKRRRWFYSSASPDQRRGFRGRTYDVLPPEVLSG